MIEHKLSIAILLRGGGGFATKNHEIINIPQSDLLLGVLDGVGTVAQVAADINAEVTADGAGEGGQGVGLAEEDTARLDDTLTRPDHGDLENEA